MTNGGEFSTTPRPAWTSVPLGVSYFPGELVRTPKLYASIIFRAQERAFTPPA